MSCYIYLTLIMYILLAYVRLIQKKFKLKFAFHSLLKFQKDALSNLMVLGVLSFGTGKETVSFMPWISWKTMESSTSQCHLFLEWEVEGGKEKKPVKIRRFWPFHGLTLLWSVLHKCLLQGCYLEHSSNAAHWKLNAHVLVGQQKPAFEIYGLRITHKTFANPMYCPETISL